MIKVVPAWMGNQEYQLDIETDTAGVAAVDIYFLAYRKLYYAGRTTIGQSFMTIPDTVPYGPTQVHAVGLDAAGSVLDASAGHFIIHEDGARNSPFVINMTRSQVEIDPEYSQNISGYRLVIKVEDAVGLPKKIFLFRKNNDWDYDVGDEFQGVCRPGDFDKYPEEVPAAGEMYRKAVIDVTSPDAAELETLWNLVQRDTKQLLESLKANANLGDVENVTVT